MNTAVRVLFTNWQLAPAGLLSDLVTVDADRLNSLTCSLRTSQATQTQIWTWLWQRPPSTPVVHCLQTVHDCQLLLCLPMAYQSPPAVQADAGQKQKKKHLQRDFKFIMFPMGTRWTSRKWHWGHYLQRTENCRWSCCFFSHAWSSQATSIAMMFFKRVTHRLLGILPR